MYKLIEEFYKENYSTLVKRLNSRAGGVENAEDVLQESFFRALRYCDSFDPTRQEIGAWFNTIMNNTLKVHQSEQMQGGATIPYDEHKHEETYECAEAAKLQLAEIIGGIDELGEYKRNVLYLYFIKSYKMKEIHDVVGGSYRTIQSMVGRYKAVLLGENCDDD